MLALFESVALIVNELDVKLDPTVGVPVIAPVALFNDKPVGREPLTNAKVGVEPESSVADNVTEYALSLVAVVSAPAEVTHVGAVFGIVNVLSTKFPPESVALTTVVSTVDDVVVPANTPLVDANVNPVGKPETIE